MASTNPFTSPAHSGIDRESGGRKEREKKVKSGLPADGTEEEKNPRKNRDSPIDVSGIFERTAGHINRNGTGLN